MSPIMTKASRQWEEDINSQPTLPVRDITDSYTPQEGQKLPARAWPVAPLYPDAPYAITSGSQTRRFEEASFHPVVSAALDFRLRGAFQDPYDIEDPNKPDIYNKHPYYKILFKRHVDMILRNINNYTEYGHQSFKDMLKGILRNGHIFGFQIPEFDFEQRDHEWQVSEVVVFDPKRFDIYINQVGQWEGFRDTMRGQYFEGQILGKFAILPYPTTRNGNYYGQSIIQPIVRDVEILRLIEDAAVRAQEALSVRPLIHNWSGKLKPDDVLRVYNVLKDLRALGVISVPMTERLDPNGVPTGEWIKSQEFDVLPDRASGDGLRYIDKLLEYYPKRINRALGVPDDLGLTTVSGGAYAKSKAEEDAVVAPVHSQDRDYIVNFLNTWYIPNVIKYNDGWLPEGYKPPRFGRADMDFRAAVVAQTDLAA